MCMSYCCRGIKTYVCAKHKYEIKAEGLCPTCRKPLLCMGVTFRTPKKRDSRAWNTIFLKGEHKTKHASIKNEKQREF